MISEAFRTHSLSCFHVNLPEKELAVLYSRYKMPDSERVDFTKFLRETKNRTPTKKYAEIANSRKAATIQLTGSPRQISNLHAQHDALKGRSLYEIVLIRLYKAIRKMFPSTPSKKVLMHKCIQLLGWERDRPLVLTQYDIRHTLYNKFGVDLKTDAVNAVFAALDPTNFGEIKIRKLLGDTLKIPSAIFADERNTVLLQKSLDTKELTATAPMEKPDAIVSEDELNRKQSSSADQTIDKNKNADYPSIPLKTLEDMIFAKVSDKNVDGHSLQQCFLFCFGDSRQRNRLNYLTLDQFKYTLRVRFQLAVNNDDIEKLFAKYDAAASGSVNLEQLARKLISERIQDEPVIDNAETQRTMLLSNETFINSSRIRILLEKIRNGLELIANEESRAPTYLLQTTNKMTRNQCEQFLRTKLRLQPLEAADIDELFQLYGFDDSKRLVDMKRVLLDAWQRVDLVCSLAPTHANLSPRKHPSDCSSDFFIGGRNPAQQRPGSAPAATGQASLSPRKPQVSATVDVTVMPKSLQTIHKSPDDIRSMLYSKLFSKSYGNNPLAVLHKVFRENSDHSRNSRYSSKQRLREVLLQNDIIVSDAEFEAFFRPFALPEKENQFEIRVLLMYLLPADFTDDDVNHTSITTMLDRDKLGATNSVHSTLLAREQDEAFQLAEKMLLTLTGPPTTAQLSARGDASGIGSTYHDRKFHMTAGSQMAWMLSGQSPVSPNRPDQLFGTGTIYGNILPKQEKQPLEVSKTPEIVSRSNTPISVPVCKVTPAIALTISPIRPQSAPSSASIRRRNSNNRLGSPGTSGTNQSDGK